MARVYPDPASIGDMMAWEFYAGGHGTDAKWIKGDVASAVPLVAWQNHTGVVTMTYMAGIGKYVLSISTATFYPYMTKQVRRKSIPRLSTHTIDLCHVR